MLALLDGAGVAHRRSRRRFCKPGKLLIAQTANILLFLGERHGLAPRDEASRLWAHQLQLTIADFVAEVHDTHHPIAASLYYEDQKRGSEDAGGGPVRRHRVPKFLGYFERALLARTQRAASSAHASRTPICRCSRCSRDCATPFPRAMKRVARAISPHRRARARVAARPRIAAYLASPRRIPFNEQGIFRHYPELDA